MNQDPNTKELTLKRAYVEKILELTMAAFTLVAALAWNDAIQSVFVRVFGPASNALAKVIYALVVTAIVVWVGLRLSRLTKKYSEK